MVFYLGANSSKTTAIKIVYLFSSENLSETCKRNNLPLSIESTVSKHSSSFRCVALSTQLFLCYCRPEQITRCMSDKRDLFAHTNCELFTCLLWILEVQ